MKKNKDKEEDRHNRFFVVCEEEKKMKNSLYDLHLYKKSSCNKHYVRTI